MYLLLIDNKSDKRAFCNSLSKKTAIDLCVYIGELDSKDCTVVELTEEEYQKAMTHKNNLGENRE